MKVLEHHFLNKKEKRSFGGQLTTLVVQWGTGESNQNWMNLNVKDFIPWVLLELRVLFQKLTNFNNFAIFGYFL